jgi:DNA polymerase-3 subunit epsilon
MVAAAPKFSEIAADVYDVLQQCIFVAHNVNFDYSFVHHELKKNDFYLSNKKLCTVKYSRKVFAGYRSYSLGNICRQLGITINDRHRAGGDCMATYYLLLRCLAADKNEKALNELIKNKLRERNLPLQLDANNYLQLPTATGVYYFLDSKQKIIYIGKAKNIKKRVASHFAGNKVSKQRQEFVRNIAYIKYTLVPTELMSLILESVEIKQHWPKYNNAQKNYEHQYALYSYMDQLGYKRLCVDKKKKNLPYIITVKNKVDGLIALRNMAIHNNLCPDKCEVAYIAEDNAHKQCNGTCNCYKSVKRYNTKVDKVIHQVQNSTESYLYIEEGHEASEASVIAVQQGLVTAMGVVPMQKKYNSKTVEKLTALKPNNYINSLLNHYAMKFPEKVHFF